MTDLEKILEEIKGISYQFEKIAKKTNYDFYSDSLELEFDYENPDEQLLQNELNIILEKMSEVKNKVDYLTSPIKDEGRLSLNWTDRYCLNEHEYHCGNKIEFFYIPDDEEEYPRWIISRIEHDKEYYIVGYENINLDGLRVRVR